MKINNLLIFAGTFAIGYIIVKKFLFDKSTEATDTNGQVIKLKTGDVVHKITNPPCEVQLQNEQRLMEIMMSADGEPRGRTISRERLKARLKERAKDKKYTPRQKGKSQAESFEDINRKVGNIPLEMVQGEDIIEPIPPVAPEFLPTGLLNIPEEVAMAYRCPKNIYQIVKIDGFDYTLRDLENNDVIKWTDMTSKTGGVGFGGLRKIDMKVLQGGSAPPTPLQQRVFQAPFYAPIIK
jgi:hypothetical protein